MIVRISNLVTVWHTDSAGWLARMDYEKKPPQPEWEFIFIQTENRIEDDLEQRFHQRR